VQLTDKNGKVRIAEITNADGNAMVLLTDIDGKSRIGAATFSDGTIDLPTKDLNTPKEP